MRSDDGFRTELVAAIQSLCGAYVEHKHSESRQEFGIVGSA